MENLIIQTGLQEHHRRQAAEIYYEAFHDKMHALQRKREQLLIIFSDGFIASEAITAISEGRLLGLAGLQHGNHHFSSARLRTSIHQLGYLRGVIFLIFFRFFSQSARKSELMIESLAVADGARSKGVGTKLIQAVFQLAREQGFQTVGLDVVDTNPRARILYERLGFMVTRTYHIPLLKPLVGFSGWTKMIKQL